jgi:uncharacterized caspase-like protein
MKRVKIVFSGWGRNRQDVRQDAFQPGHFPLCAFGKNPLHVDAEVNSGLSGRAVAQFVIL